MVRAELFPFKLVIAPLDARPSYRPKVIPLMDAIIRFVEGSHVQWSIQLPTAMARERVFTVLRAADARAFVELVQHAAQAPALASTDRVFIMIIYMPRVLS